ncbi:hypothetical protein, partial [Enterocloster lavalensis]|uniref:hypothetical protein n=1 Tax=Enterocloster lavalensis TaxID=460384 RepID=UPI0034A1369B
TITNLYSIVKQSQNQGFYEPLYKCAPKSTLFFTLFPFLQFYSILRAAGPECRILAFLLSGGVFSPVFLI